MKCALGDIATISNGYPFRGRISDDPAGDIAVLSIKHVTPDLSPVLKDLPRVLGASLKGLDRYLVNEGDVVFQSRGYRLNAMVVDRQFDVIAAQGIYVIRPKSEIVSAAYLSWYLNHENCQRRLQSNVQGTRIPLMPMREFEALNLSVPDKEAQEQIVQLNKTRQQQKQLQTKLDESTDKLISALCWQKSNES